MELFTYFRSSAAYRVRIALNIKGIEHRLTPVNLLTGEHHGEAYRALNPQGLLPALKLDSGELLTQSTAILEYLESLYPQTPLLPADPVAAAQVRAWANLVACDIHPVDNLRVLKYLKDTLNISDDDKTAWYLHWIREGFDVLEEQLVAAPFCHGSGVTLADLYLIPQVYNALRFNLDMSAYPKIRSIWDACNALPAFDAARPESQPDSTI
ncbi:maleylacetoacetate isomerase [Marinobacterium sedimentorum]|uniref:maleylacetoacetate isomerase n=1 Tax=Marinobacterium sedimentorum TaxID=2927804 RepID=UPI0020C71756|nr:maleylacetoacetate isomerase [Marinobacterium sedimentorum]MCP8686654.1 maleylacetoacetate isomerase [Marinobacterium sedimentorum]